MAIIGGIATKIYYGGTCIYSKNSDGATDDDTSTTAVIVVHRTELVHIDVTSDWVAVGSIQQPEPEEKEPPVIEPLPLPEPVELLVWAVPGWPSTNHRTEVRARAPPATNQYRLNTGYAGTERGKPRMRG